MGTVLVLGGAGAVGAAVLASLLDAGHQVVATHRRSPDPLGQVPGVHPIVVDVTDGDAYARALHGVDLVINCTGREDLELVRGAAAHGVDFLDVGAGAPYLAAVHAFDADLRAAGTRAVVGVGLAPGLTGLLAAAAAAADPLFRPVAITVVLGLGGPHGAAATRWLLGQLRQRTADHARRVDLPGFRRRRAVPVDFGDSASLTQHLGVPVASACSLEPRWASAAVRLLARTPHPERALLRWRPLAARLLHGHDRWAVHATAGPATAWATGRDQTTATAAVAAWAGHRVLTEAWPAGAHDLHSTSALEEVAPALRRSGVTIAH